MGIPQQRQEEDQQARATKERIDQYLDRNGNASGHEANDRNV